MVNWLPENDNATLLRGNRTVGLRFRIDGIGRGGIGQTIAVGIACRKRKTILSVRYDMVLSLIAASTGAVLNNATDR